MSAVEPLDPQVAELLSAYLDGAVTDEERAAAEAWIERSPAARAEYESLAAVKGALGGLGAVEPPFGFYDRMLRQGTPRPVISSAVKRAAAVERRPARRSAAPVILSLVASAAAFVFIGGAAFEDPAVPDVDAVADGSADGTRALRGDAGPIRALRQEVDAVDWDEMPPGLRLDEGDTEIWQQLDPPSGEERVVVFRDGAVVTVAAEDVEAEALLGEALDLLEEEPASDPGLLGQVRDACEGLVRSLALGD